MIPPVPGIDPGPELDLKLGPVDFILWVIEPISDYVEDSIFDRMDMMQRPGDIRDDILFVVRRLDIDKQRDPAASFKAPPQFPRHARRAHASLPCEQYVISVPDLSIQYC